MKKKLCLMATIVLIAISALAATTGWILVEDSCKKCTITNLEYKCGLCKTGMSTSFKWDNKKEYLVYTFTCNNTKCNHTCKYKTKP